MTNLRIIGLAAPSGKRIKASEHLSGAKFTSLLPRHLLSVSPFRSITTTVRLPEKGVKVPESILLEGLAAMKDEDDVIFVGKGEKYPADRPVPKTVKDLVSAIEKNSQLVEIWLNVGRAKGEDEADKFIFALFLHLAGSTGKMEKDGLQIAIPLKLEVVKE